MSNFFSRPTPIEFTVTMSRNSIVGEAVSILNKIAEARFDGQNTQYVNNMQPEIDFEQDRDIAYGFYEDGINNIAQRIEPYVSSYTDEATAGDYVFSLSMPEDWKSNLKPALENKMKSYLLHYIIAQWLEKVSLSDTEWTTKKANELLGKVKWTCELRNGKVHKVWNGTY